MITSKTSRPLPQIVWCPSPMQCPIQYQRHPADNTKHLVWLGMGVQRIGEVDKKIISLDDNIIILLPIYKLVEASQLISTNVIKKRCLIWNRLCKKN